VSSPDEANPATTTPPPEGRRSHLPWSRQTIVGYLILAATTVAGFASTGVALHAVSDRTRDNQRNVCAAAWDRYDGRVGLRSEMFALRDRFIPSTNAAYVDFTVLTDANVQRIDRPECPRPKTLPPERSMP
jgi:hypothetical protein